MVVVDGDWDVLCVVVVVEFDEMFIVRVGLC